MPFLVQWKGKLPAGKIYDHPVIQLDIQPTALAAAGVAAKPEWKLDGVNLLPFLRGQEHRARRTRRSTGVSASRWRSAKGDWKLVAPDLGDDRNSATSPKADAVQPGRRHRREEGPGRRSSRSGSGKCRQTGTVGTRDWRPHGPASDPGGTPLKK